MANNLLSDSLVDTIKTATTKFNLCRNRLWAAAKSLGSQERDQFLQILADANAEQTGGHEGHDQCTFDFCEYSRLNFTTVAQRHESCVLNNCGTKWFDSRILEAAVSAGKPTAWVLDGMSAIKPPQPFMAISHVWSDGTGVGAWPPGQVNQCLYGFFMKIAEQFQCQGIWWDTICIPMEKGARSKAVINIHRNYEDARITLVHDYFLRTWEWVNPEVACFAIIISPWFSRGWTALELAKSRKVKVIFKGLQGPVIKDLDEDILAKVGASSRHRIASGIIQALRKRGFAELDELLSVLGPRETSWPRDVAIISGQLAGIRISPNNSQQAIYQDILKKIGQISHGHLFHNSATMSKRFTWCPTSLFDIPQSSTPATLLIGRNGDVTGEWDTFGVLDLFEKRFNWKDTHPLIKAEVWKSLKNRDKHLLLADPKDEFIPRAILVRIMNVKDLERVQFVGPVYFHPPLGRHEFSDKTQTRIEKVTIAGTAFVDNGEENEENRWTPNKGDEHSQNLDLLAASTIGDEEKITLLLKRRFSLNVQDTNGDTPLHLATKNGHDKVVALLLEKGADPDLKDEDTWTPLHYATWKCYDDIVRQLLDGEADGNIQDRFGQAALHFAAERGNKKIVKNLLDKNVDLSAQCYDSQTALHRAAWGGSKEVVKFLLEQSNHGPILNVLDKDKRTALHVAAERGQTLVVELLLLHNAEPNARDTMEKTPLHLAAQNGHNAVVALLLDNTELELEDHNGLTPLLLAVRNGHKLVVDQLLQAHAEVESRSSSGMTPLMWATERGHKEVVELLINRGANMKSMDSGNRTPLQLAAENGHENIVQLLLSYGSNPDFKDSGGQTPLLWAAEKGYTMVVKQLLNSGANPNLEDNNYQTPLLVAAKNGYSEVVKILLDKNVNPEARDNDDWTALLWAAKFGHEAVVRLLLGKDADMEYEDREGNTPLDIAAGYECWIIVALLLENGAKLKHKVGGEALLQIAWNREVTSGHAVAAKLLIENSADLEYKDSIGATPLLIAAGYGTEVIVKLLLEKGAKVRCKDNQGETPLWAAFSWNKKEPIVKLLLENGAEPASKEDGGQMLLWALEEGHMAIAKLILNRSVNLESTDKENRTSLSWAAEKGYVEIVKILLRKGAIVDHRERVVVIDEPIVCAVKFEDTTILELLLDRDPKVMSLHNGECVPLQKAMSAHNAAAVEVLLKKGAKFQGDGGWVLDWVVKKGHEGVAKQLLKMGAKIEYTDGSSRTPLSWAAELGNKAILKQLLKRGANVEARDSNGRTPLFHAVGDIEVVKLLLEAGANPESKDRYGRMPLSRAVAHGYKDVIKLLTEANNDRAFITTEDESHDLRSRN